MRMSVYFALYTAVPELIGIVDSSRAVTELRLPGIGEAEQMPGLAGQTDGRRYV